jgi:microcystin-dependent protein
MEAFIGQLALVAFNYAPQNWALCNGQILPISQYAALFSLLGTSYGGDGVTTFALPNLQGRVPIHAGSGAGLSPYNIGQNGGVESVALNVTQMPAHSHQINTYDSATTPPVEKSPTGNILGGPTKFASYASEAPNSTLSANSVTPQGGSTPHTNLQPFLVLNWVICLNGIYPSRG